MLKRTIKLILYLIVSSFIIFVLVEKTSGNPAILYLQRHGYTSITQENIEAAQHKLGLGQHFLLRYIDWVGHALTGNLGYSFSTNEPVTTMIMDHSNININRCFKLYHVAIWLYGWLFYWDAPTYSIREWYSWIRSSDDFYAGILVSHFVYILFRSTLAVATFCR